LRTIDTFLKKKVIEGEKWYKMALPMSIDEYFYCNYM